MATLVLRTVGSAVAGPLGAVVGAALGYQIDQKLLGPGRREGPRLGDLAVQGSTYGAPIPRIYGRMRVAGTVVWATDLVESEAVTGAKGQPETMSYSYSVSFAVALSARRISSIGRIWADGKLLRGAAGDLKVDGSVRFLLGDEDQLGDPLIDSIEGEAPAYRGLALAIFEDLQLADYGNRIPMLTFEVIADADAPTLGDLMGDLSNGDIESNSTQVIEGYAAHGPSVRAALSPLEALFGLDFSQEEGALIDRGDNGYPLVVADQLLGASRDDGDPSVRAERSRLALASMPRRMSLDHYDPARDYQAGRASAEGDPQAREEIRVDAPITLQADTARGMVERSLRETYRRRERIDLRLAPAMAALRPGDLVTHDDLLWRVDRVAHEEGIVVASGHLTGASSGAATIGSDAGTPSRSSDVLTLPTEIALFDLPDLGDGAQSRLFVAAASASPGWRSVPIEWEVGGQVATMASAGRESILGVAETVLGTASSSVIDRDNEVVIALVDDDHWLASVDDDGLMAGENLAVLGSELIQFGDAVPLGGGRFRLSRLLRGLRGTEWAAMAHGVGDAFAMVDRRRLAAIEIARERVGGLVRATPLGLADAGEGTRERVFEGEALHPPSPAHVNVNVAGDGAAQVSWVARSRLAWGWTDGVEPGLGEARMAFRVTVAAPGQSIVRDTDLLSFDLSAAELAPFAGAQVQISVVAIGDYAASHPATKTVQL